MKFIAIVMAILIERFWPQVQDVRKLDAFERYLHAMRVFLGSNAIFDGVLGAALVFVPAIIAIGWLQLVLSKGLLLLFGLIFAVVLLVASIGPHDLLALVKGYVEASRRGDATAAQDNVERLIDGPVPDDEAERNRAVAQALFRGVVDWFPAAIFWFAIFGPVGAVTFRLMASLNAQANSEVQASGFTRGAVLLYELAIWIPARITVLAYALIGSFDDTWQAWRRVSKEDGSLGNTPAVMLAAGMGATRLDHEGRVVGLTDLMGCVALLRRTVIVWIALLALATLSGFLR